MKKLGFIFCCLLAVFAIFVARYSLHKDESKEETIRIADKVFVIPSYGGSRWASFYEKKQWLSFHLNVNTFAPQRTDTLEQKKSALNVEVGPRWSISRKYYWTEKDKILKQKPISCEVHDYAGKEFKFCDHGADSKRIASPLKYTIVNESGDVISYLECTKKENRLRNPQCDVRTRFTDNLQINYRYNIENVSNAVEIDRRLRDLISKLYQDNQ